MSSKFYAEELGVGEAAAESIAQFMLVAHNLRAIVSAKPWAKENMARVYIEIWSQNKLPAVTMLERAYYDCAAGEILLQQYGYGRHSTIKLRDLVKMGRCNFSGAKTRAALVDLVEAVDG